MELGSVFAYAKTARKPPVLRADGANFSTLCLYSLLNAHSQSVFLSMPSVLAYQRIRISLVYGLSRSPFAGFLRDVFSERFIFWSFRLIAIVHKRRYVVNILISGKSVRLSPARKRGREKSLIIYERKAWRRYGSMRRPIIEYKLANKTLNILVIRTLL